jgi:nucleoredoxin
LQVIYVSADHDKESFEEYYAEMPWSSVPFESTLRDGISEKFGVEGIPRVIVLSGADGKVVNDDARPIIAAKKTLSGVF